LAERIPGLFDEQSAAQILSDNDEYRVLRRLGVVSEYADLAGEDTGRGLVVDVETTGLHHHDDRIIEIGMVPFEYGVDTGSVGRVEAAISLFEDPGRELDPTITRLTGITDEMVAGQRIDDQVVGEQFKAADIVIAHNAAFDRPFVEGRFGSVAGARWACSFREVPWEVYSYRCHKLACLLEDKCSVFFDGHRAGTDCLALLHLLATPFPDAKLPMKLLLESAHRDTVRIWATGAPFAVKDLLKDRGYRWNPGENGEPKAWWREVFDSDEHAELAWLTDAVYEGAGGQWQLRRHDARSRYVGKTESRPGGSLAPR